MRTFLGKGIFLFTMIFYINFTLGVNNNLPVYNIQSDSLYVYPSNIYVDMDPGSQASEILTICNQSDTVINYYLDFESEEPPSIKQKYYCKELFQYDLTSSFEHGIETDGEFIYTSSISSIVYRSDLGGNIVDTLNIEDTNTIWDLAFDGSFFYGGSGQNFIYEMDFENEELVSIINTSAPTEALAYNEDLDVFYGASGNVITCFDRNGITINEIPIEIEGLNGISGLAYDCNSHGGPFLWAYGYHLYSMNILIRLPLTNTTTNMIMCDVAKITPSLLGTAGGLCIDNHLYDGYWTIGGIMANNLMFGLELTFNPNWFSYYPVSGQLIQDDCDEIELVFNPEGEYLPSGVYEGSVYVTTEPNIGNETVDVELAVMGGYFMPMNLTAEIIGKSVVLNWEHPIIPGDFDYRIYANTYAVDIVQDFTYVLGPLESGIELYYIGTVLPESNYTETSYPISIIVKDPQLIPPKYFNAVADSNAVLCNWVSPGPVSDLYGFNLYRNGELLNTTIITDTFYFDMNAPLGPNYYFATSFYEYGESENSDTATVVISHIQDLFENAELSLFPNPTSNMIIISSPIGIQSIQVRNNYGIDVCKKEIKSMNFELDISDFKAGIYYFSIYTGAGIQIRKVVVK